MVSCSLDRFRGIEISGVTFPSVTAAELRLLSSILTDSGAFCPARAIDKKVGTKKY
jgi:hypothetical protein